MKRWLLACLTMLCMVALLVGWAVIPLNKANKEAYECWFVLVLVKH